MRLLLPILSASLLLTQSVVESRWTPKPGSTWNYLLGVDSDSEILGCKEQVLTIDVNKSKSLIDKLHSRGQKVICYFSGGTLETHRSDKSKYLAVSGLVKSEWSRWDEQFVDYRKKSALKPLIKSRMEMAISKNCDAIEVDCIDTFYQAKVRGWKDPLTKDDAKTFALWLSDLAHELGISIGLKNTGDLAPQLVDKFDFAVVESCSQSSNVCSLFKDFPKQGKAVFTVHYGSFGSQVSRMVKEQKNLGYTCTFNPDEDLHHPGFSYNCDTGSKSDTSGKIPAQTSKPNAGNAPANAKAPANGAKAPNAPVNGAAAPNALNGMNAAPGATKNIPGMANGVNGTANAIPGLLNNTLAPNTTLGLAPTTSNVNLVPTQTLDKTIAGSDSNEKKDDGSKTPYAITAITLGGVATAAAALAFIKKNKKKTDNYPIDYQTDYQPNYQTNYQNNYY